MSLTVVEINQFPIGRIVAYHNVQIAVAIDIRQSCGVRAVRSISKVVPGEVPFSVSQQHTIEEWPMPALSEHDVEVPVMVQISHADACRGLGLFLE